jgi:hypothetical protein
MEIIETKVDTAIAEIICGGHSAKMFFIGTSFVAPPPLPILT